ncbi:S1C family serine protease [Aquihabitans sp. McL0605]|uniref:S1C family serine protease n=1 Tax=Aquihabitans sp. McL0605 TaxID=3415671 RepID=UPI003CEC4D44
MSNDPTPRPPSMWSPTSAPTAPTAAAGVPPGPPYPQQGPRPTPTAPPWIPQGPPPAPVARPGAYPSAGSPPVAGGGQPPSWPPTGPGGFHQPPAPAPTPGPKKSRRGRNVALVVAAAALLAGSAGGAVGALVADRNSPSNDASAPVATSPISTETQVPPVKGSSSEPAEAVAAALGPAVVQIETDKGLGSGFIYDASGLILTASHVTDGASTVSVRMADGTKLTGQVVGEDASTDVAVVKIDPPKNMPVATLATGVTTKVGQIAIAIGSPFGLDQSVTAGIVSAVGRSAETPGGVIPAIQTDAPINSGNSGGALADRSGRVIGINDSIATGGGNSTGNLGIGFAIPIDIAKSVADRIVAGQSTEAGFLGVEGADATGDHTGAAVTSVSSGSPAAKAGLTTDDVVIAVDGKPVASMIDLAAKVRTHQPGESVVLTVEKNGQQRDITVTLGTAPAN